VKLSELHLTQYARLDGSMAQTFTSEQGWDITVRPDLGGVILQRDVKGVVGKAPAMWLPFANCRNGVPQEVPPRAGK
jgi:hypothetical protein